MSRTGRPTKVTPEIESSAWDYVNGGWEIAGHAFPSVVGLVDVIGVPRRTVYDWINRDDNDFSLILEAINAKQELVAFDRGMRNEYNASLVKLLLGKHGYHDKQDVKQETNLTFTQLTDEELERIVNSKN